MTQPTDWAAQFQELAGDAGQMSTRALNRYQELLKRVARGELKPEQLQKQFSDYVQEQASPATRELVEVSLGLLTGLLHAEARYREALLDGLLPPGEPLPTPPSASGVDLLTWFQTLASYATAQAARSASRHQVLVERIAAGQISAAQVQERNRRFLEEQAPQFVNEVMQLGLAFVKRLQRSSFTLTDTLYDRVLGPDADSESAPEPPICVELRGPSGSVASASIVVENTRNRAADVVCRVSEFVARAFGRRVRSALEISPSQFTLAAGEQRDVELHLPLDASVFAPGAEYVATLQISGAGERELIVQLLARADLAAEARGTTDASTSSTRVEPAEQRDTGMPTHSANESPARSGSGRLSPSKRKRR